MKLLIEKEDDKSPLNISLGLLGSSNSNNSANTFLTQEYIQSREMLYTLEDSLAIREHYQSKKIDLLSRLKQHPTQREWLKYYRKQVTAQVDPTTNEINISVKAFNPEEAKLIADSIINIAHGFVNRVSNTVADKQYRFAKIELKQAKEKLFDAGKDMVQFQNKYDMLDPAESAKLVSEVMGQLKSELVKKQTELITYSAFMQPRASKIIGLKEEISSIKNQMHTENSQLLGAKQKKEGKKLNQVLVEYEWLKLQITFANAEYQAAQMAYNMARVALAKQSNMLIEISPPNLPDEYAYPRISYDLVNAFILLLILFLLTKMVIIIVQEHID